MPWSKLDDQFYDHPKTVAVGTLGAGLFALALSWTAKALTDGFVPRAMILRLAADIDDPIALAETLVSAGMFEAVNDGYLIHDYLIYNPSAEYVKAERKENARRQAEWRERHRDEAGRFGVANNDRNAVTNAVTNEEGNAVVTTAPFPSPSPSLQQQQQQPARDYEPPADPNTATLFQAIRAAGVAIAGTMQAEAWRELLTLTDDASLLREAVEETVRQGKQPSPAYVSSIVRRCVLEKCRPGERTKHADSGNGARASPPAVQAPPRAPKAGKNWVEEKHEVPEHVKKRRGPRLPDSRKLTE